MAKKKNDRSNDTPPRKKRPFYDGDRPLHRILPCLLVMAAVLLGFFLILDVRGANDIPLGRGIVWLFRGLYANCVYLLPAMLLWMGVRWRSDIRSHRAVRRIVYYALLPVLIDALYFTIAFAPSARFSFRDFFLAGVEQRGAGLLGSLLGYGLWILTKYIGIPVLIALYVVLFFYDFLGITPSLLLEKKAKRRAARAADAPAAAESAAGDAETAIPPAQKEKPVVTTSAEPSARARKRALKEADRARRMAERAETARRAGEEAGYFPSEAEETFDELRRRLDAEQLELRRSGLTEEQPRPTTTYEVRPPRRAGIRRAAPREDLSIDTPLPTPAAKSPAPALTAHTSASPITDASRADTVFRSFDPLRADAFGKGAEPVLFPSAADGREHRETLSSLTRKKDTTDAADAFRIKVARMQVSTVNAARGEPSEEESPRLTDYEDITDSATSSEMPVSPLPYVHPATQASTQPQAARPPFGYMPPAPPAGEAPDLPTLDGAAPTPVVPDAPKIRSYEETAATDPGIAITDRVVEHGARYPIPDAPQKPAAPAADSAAPKRTTPDYSKNYVFPPLSLLNRPIPVVTGDAESEIQELGRLLIAAFATFKIEIQIKEVVVGPRITRFSIEPPAGVRINTLTNLTEDICRLMSSKTLRIESIPETPYLGVEIPNRRPTNVSLASLIDTEAFRKAKNVTTVPLGAGVTGAPVFADICKMPHLLVAGATGMGKSVFVNSILLSLLYRARPDEVKLILVDPKQVEMSLYNGIPHLLIPPVIDAKRAAGALIWAVGEMERRYQLMVKANVRTIESYNDYVRAGADRGEVQPKIIIVIDELNDLMMQAKDAVESSIMRLAQKARAAGIHLILGTQRPSVDVITGTIKANIPSRVALHVTSGTDSRTILDVYGAEKLLDKGDMLVMLAGAEPMRIQSAFASDEEVENVTTFLRNNAGPVVYDEIVSAQIESETEKYKNSGKKERTRDEGEDDYDGSIFEDSRFMEACNVAFECGKISTSLLQRRCKLGYGKAAGYIDTMQIMGIVSEPDGSKPREILMTKDQFMEMVARESHSGD